MVSSVFIDLVNNLWDMGVFDVVLPFLLFFTIMFAILQKTKVLGHSKDNKELPRKSYNVVVAVVIALMIIIPHITMNGQGTDSTTLSNGWPDPVVVVNKSLPQISVITVAIVMMLLLIGIVSPVQIKLSSSWTIGAAVLSSIVVFFIFGSSLFESLPPWFSNFEEYLPIIVIILVFGLIVYFITKEPDEEPWENKSGRWSGHLTRDEDEKKHNEYLAKYPEPGTEEFFAKYPHLKKK